MDTLEFINKANKKHNNKYDYSISIYKGSFKKITIICPIHGKFTQTASKHLSGSGCKLCANKIIKNKLSLSQDTFIKKASEVHDNKYDYSKINYINSKTKVKIVCPVHGEFSQSPSDHLNGHGCQKCSHIKSNLSNVNAFIKKAKEVHNNKYDYSLCNYVNSKIKVVIICPKHGKFEQTPNNHLSGFGCKKCSHEVNYLKLQEDFIKKAIAKHGTKFDYSLVNYRGSFKKVKIICPVHGAFEQTPCGHLQWGCKQCSHSLFNKDRKHSNQSIITKFQKIHGEKYDYSNLDYKDFRTNVNIICPVHGDYYQLPYNHLKGCGCAKCNRKKISKAHKDIINVIKNLKEDALINDLTMLNGKELDIYVPNKKLAIEYNGLYYHSYSDLSNEDKMKHFRKTEMCAKIGIQLIQIFENEWENKQEIVKSILTSKLNKVTHKIFARNCKIGFLDSKEYDRFVMHNHIQGINCTRIRLGLFHKNKLCCVLGLNKHKEFRWEIIRFCSLLNTTVIGGFSKLLAHFIKNYKPSSIMTYADRRYSVGNVYLKNNFKLDKITKPGYFYVKGAKLFNRRQFQKHLLADKLSKFNPNLSEAQNMFNNGFRRIWDCGHFRFIKTLNST